MIDILQDMSLPYDIKNNENFTTYNIHTVKYGIESIRHLEFGIWYQMK